MRKDRRGEWYERIIGWRRRVRVATTRECCVPVDRYLGAGAIIWRGRETRSTQPCASRLRWTIDIRTLCYAGRILLYLARFGAMGMTKIRAM